MPNAANSAVDDLVHGRGDARADVEHAARSMPACVAGEERGLDDVVDEHELVGLDTASKMLTVLALQQQRRRDIVQDAGV